MGLDLDRGGAKADMIEQKSKATSGRIFPEVIVLPIILWAGALVVYFLAGVAGPPLLNTLLSYLGSSLVALLPILGVFVAVSLAKGWDEVPDVSPLVYTIPYLATLTLGAGLYYVIHDILVLPFLVSLSEMLGGLVVFLGGWMLLTVVLERRRRCARDGLPLP